MATSAPRPNQLPDHLANLPAARFYGRGVEGLFGNEDEVAPLRTVPWASASRLKAYSPWDQELVARTLSGRSQPPLTDVDPIDLRANQPSITRAGVSYYAGSGSDYHKTGKTFENSNNAGNRFPVIYRREPSPINPRAGAENVILSGHHRAAAALAMGRPLKAIMLEGPWGPKR